MNRRYRVERERTDHGYGDSWVVLNIDGDVVWAEKLWVNAFGWAIWFATDAHRAARWIAAHS